MATLKSALQSLHWHVAIPNRFLTKVSTYQLHLPMDGADYHQCMCCQSSLIYLCSDPWLLFFATYELPMCTVQTLPLVQEYLSSLTHLIHLVSWQCLALGRPAGSSLCRASSESSYIHRSKDDSCTELMTFCFHAFSTASAFMEFMLVLFAP